MNYLTKREAQDYLKVSHQAMSQWLQEDKLPGAEKIDGNWRIPAGSVEDARMKRIRYFQKRIEEISRPVPVMNGGD